MSSNTFSIVLPNEAATAALARQIAPHLNAGDTLLLDGHIGAGKTTFSRALIRARIGQDIDVPSPTFTLVQTYEHETGDIWHCDLYRLTHPDEAFELGLDEAFLTAICLIEWPDRLGAEQPENAALMVFAAGDSRHTLEITLSDEMAARIGSVLADA